MDYSSGLTEEVHVTSLWEVTPHSCVRCCPQRRAPGQRAGSGQLCGVPTVALGVYKGFLGRVGEKALPEVRAAADTNVYEHQ